MRRWLPLLLLGLLAQPGAARRRRRATAPPPVAPVAWLPVARAALAGGHLDKAVQALQGARTCWAERADACGFARADYDLVLGATYLAAGDHAKAAPALARALEAHPDQPALWLHLAQCRFELADWSGAAEAFARGAPAAADQPMLYARWARAHLKAGAPEAARAVLLDGLERLPTADILRRELALIYARFARFGAAETVALAMTDATERGAVLRAIAGGLMDAGDPAAAARVYEAARLLTPSDPELLGLHAHALAAQGNPAAAARLFARGGDAFAAAEQARLAGRAADALRFNARVHEAPRRLRQRLDILLGDEQWAAAWALLGPLEPYLDDPLRYRLAYAALKAGDPGGARRLARRVIDPGLRPGARRLGKIAARCVDQPWVCP